MLENQTDAICTGRYEIERFAIVATEFMDAERFRDNKERVRVYLMGGHTLLLKGADLERFMEARGR